MLSHLKNTSKIIYAIEHHIKPEDVHRSALVVLDRLHVAGFEAYLVGGGVRDLLIGKHPNDFDIATNAEPRQIKQVFGSKCHIIGRRFRLAHVRVEKHIFEVSTFRAAPDPSLTLKEGVIFRDNQYGHIDEDAYRRDFTVNALYYDPRDNIILDFTHGFEDLQNNVLRVIGDPEVRYREDPVRMLRAIRFMAKLNLSPTSGTKKAILKWKHLLKMIPPARLYEEVNKLFLCGFAAQALPFLEYYGLFDVLFPATAPYIKNKRYHRFIETMCENTDLRVVQDKPVIPIFLFAAILFPATLEHIARHAKEGLSRIQAIETASKDIFRTQMARTQLGLWMRTTIRDIWVLEHRLEKCEARFVKRCLPHPRFRAAYDLFKLHAIIDPELQPIVEWWTQLQKASGQNRNVMLDDLRKITQS